MGVKFVVSTVVLAGIFGHREEELTGNWRQLLQENEDSYITRSFVICNLHQI
jgi:hypothetical protein